MRTKLSKSTLAGFICASAGILLLGAWLIRTRSPVTIPLPRSIGSFSTDGFRVYSNDYYLIEIDAKKRLPLSAMDCMMGVWIDPVRDKCFGEPLLQASWTVWSDGRIVASGYSEDTKGHGGWSEQSVTRDLGAFKGQFGKKYRLDMKLTNDGTAFAVTQPRLIVEYGEDPESQAIEGFLIMLCVIVLAVAAVLFIRNG